MIADACKREGLVGRLTIGRPRVAQPAKPEDEPAPTQSPGLDDTREGEDGDAA